MSTSESSSGAPPQAQPQLLRFSSAICVRLRRRRPFSDFRQLPPQAQLQRFSYSARAGAGSAIFCKEGSLSGADLASTTL